MAGEKEPKAAGSLKEESKLTNDVGKQNAINQLIEHVATACTSFIEATGLVPVVAEAPPASPPAEIKKVEPTPVIEPKPEPIQGVKATMGPKLTFDAARGKWIVEHANFQKPMVFASKQEAEAVAIALHANDVPAVEYDGDKKEFSVMHRDWEAPVRAKTPEEAQAVVASKLLALGEAEPEAQNEAKKIVEEVTPKEPAKEPTMVEPVAASVTVKADMKQSPKGGGELVSGGPQSGESAKSGPKGEMPTVPGKVVTESLAKDILPKSDFSQSIKSEMDLGHAKGLAAKSEAEIKRLMQADGFRKEMIKMASTDRGLELADQFMDLAHIIGFERMTEILNSVEAEVLTVEGKKKTSKKARKWIGKKIAKLEEEGKPKDQAIAEALSMAREEKGFESVPENPEKK